jgi:plasmid segregation protein ParM
LVKLSLNQYLALNRRVFLFFRTNSKKERVVVQIAIDVGYSHTKAVSPEGRVIIPSVAAPFRELPLADLSRNGTGHVVGIRRVDRTLTRHFVGELALREGQGATFTLDREKHRHPNHDLLILTAARLLGARTGATLVVGLPVAYYRTQKDVLCRHLEALHADVSVDGLPFERVSFGKVIVYPQGAGALLMVSDLPKSGLVCLVDVGYKTTDYVTVEMKGDKGVPVSSLCGSVEVGAHRVTEAVAAEFEVRTGAPLDATLAEGVVADGKARFRGKEVDLADVVEAARRDTARAIADRVLAALGPKGDFAARFYLAGGGVLALPELREMFPAAEVLPDPQWANAEGFLKLAQEYAEV